MLIYSCPIIATYVVDGITYIFPTNILTVNKSLINKVTTLTLRYDKFKRLIKFVNHSSVNHNFKTSDILEIFLFYLISVTIIFKFIAQGIAIYFDFF